MNITIIKTTTNRTNSESGLTTNLSIIYSEKAFTGNFRFPIRRCFGSAEKITVEAFSFGVEMKICSVTDCENRHWGKGFCRKHFERVKRYGTIEARPIRICEIQDCDNKHETGGLCKKHSERKRRHGHTNPTKFISTGKTLEERFLSKVNKTGSEGGCWLWLGTDDYGYLVIDGVNTRATHISWFLKHGYYPKLWLLHSCDNPPCVNPAHLREGTAKENANDKVLRNRQIKGEANHTSKLTEADVIEIKKLYVPWKFSCAKLAIIFGVSEPTIYAIVSGRNWKHIK